MLKAFTILMFVFFTGEAYSQKKSHIPYFENNTAHGFNKTVSTIRDKNYNHKLNRSGQLVDSTCLDCITPSAINSSLVVCMPFNGNASDLAGMNNNGTVIGATLTSDRFGNANSAYSFNGISDYINVNITPDLLTNEYTYSAWVKFNAMPPPASFLSFISIGGALMDQIIGYENFPGYTGLGFAAGSYNDQGGVSGGQSNIVPVIGTWYHIASTRDNTSIKLYINGILTASSTTGANAGYDPVSTFHIGARCGFAPTISDYGIDGIIDDIRIYNRVLDANEINQIYSSTNCNNIINTYTPILAFAPCTNKITVEDASTFNTGDTVLMIQMKGAVIDSTNTSSFGTITDYKNSGNYELNYVKNKTGNIIELKNKLTRQYDVPNGKVQLVRVPYYQNINITSTLTCLPWDGDKGGVLVLNCANDITLNADIDVSEKGFLTGSPIVNSLHPCNEGNYFYNSPANAGEKGEGISEISAQKKFGKGKLANAGGGGNSDNSGGGGGGNAGQGGNGGKQFEGCVVNTINGGGLGGQSLSNNAALNKLYLGGGGGMGHANDNIGYFPGGRGGGIAIIIGNNLISNGKKISANGGDGFLCPFGPNCTDGASGGGAGGLVLLNVPNITVNTAVEARGGKGADNPYNDSVSYPNKKLGTGGGGGGGYVNTTQNTISPLLQINVNGGISGVNTAHNSDPHGATNGQDGTIINNFPIQVSTVPFKPNIDSVKIKDSVVSCSTYYFNGLAYTNTNPIINWQWYFGDGVTGNTQNTSHIYTTTGIYVVKLMVTDSNGCKDSISRNIAVLNCNTQQGLCKSSFGFRNSDNASVNIQANSPAALHHLYDTSGFSWEAWFKLNTSIINTSSIVSTEDSVYCQDLFLGFGWGSIPDALCFMIRDNGPDCYTVTAESLQTIVPNTWYHVAAVCDYTNAIIKLYLNGNLLATAIIPPEILSNRLINDRLVQIGNQSSYYRNGIDGAIDEVRFWNTVRTQTEIQNAINQCLVLPQNGLVAYFKADENMGLTANSTVNTNFFGLLENATWATQVPAITCSSLTIVDSLTGCNNYNFYGLINNVNASFITNWQWYFGDGGTANTQNTSHTYTAAGIYAVKLIVTDNNGCKDSTTKNFTGSFQIVPASDTAICAGNSITLSVNVAQSINDTIMPPGSQFEYTFNTPAAGWTKTIGGWITGNAPFGNETNGLPPEFNYNTYWPSGVTEGADGFDLRVRRTINLAGYNLSTIRWYLGVDNGFVLYLNGIRVDSATADGYTDRWEYNGIIPTAILNADNNIIAVGLSDDGEATAFDMMITGERINSGVSVLWSTGDTTTTINVTPTQTNTYFVAVANGTNICTDSIKVVVKPSSAQTVNAAICQGENYLGYTVSGIYIDTLNAVNVCDSIRTINLIVKPKSVSTITQSICPGQNIEGYTNSGTYIDTLVAANGCDSIRTIKLTLIPKPVPDLGIDKDLCPGDSLVLYPGQFNSYQWQDGSAQKSITVKRPGLYSVAVSNICGTAKDEILIKEMICDVWFPSAFTPNNDGKNDLFKVLGAHNLSDFQLVVYNRWGQKIFETDDFTKGWPGTINGKEQDSGVFVWYCEFKKNGNVDKIKMKGTVLLIR